METKGFAKRSVATVALSVTLVMSGVLGASADPFASSSKSFASNFTLVNLENKSNTGDINYFKPDGSAWRAKDTFTLAAEGDQAIKRQYDDATLSAGSGSVVVSASGKVGAVAQVQARAPQVATFGAYSGATGGALVANVPLVARKGNSASGIANSQIVIQNTGSAATTVEVEIINADGTSRFKKTGISLAQGAAFNYDLADEAVANIPDNYFGSAVVRAAAGGSVAVVSNFFTGADAMQTFNAFTTKAQAWAAPLFTSRLANSLSTPIAVQNLSGSSIPINGIVVKCTKDAASPGANFEMMNKTALGNTASYFFNPVTDLTIPEAWFGSCLITTAGFDTVAFVQMRFVSGAQAAAYEALPTAGTSKKSVIPLYAKRLANGFASAVTIQNLSSTAAANVSLVYKGATGTPANCTVTKTAVIPAGGSLIQNHRLASGAGSVPELGDNCFGTLVVTSSDQAIDGFVQLTNYLNPPGDTFMAHTNFAN